MRGISGCFITFAQKERKVLFSIRRRERGILGYFITITRKKERKRRREEKESLITLLTLLRKVERFFLSSEDEIEEFQVTLLTLPRGKNI